MFFFEKKRKSLGQLDKNEDLWWFPVSVFVPKSFIEWKSKSYDTDTKTSQQINKTTRGTTKSSSKIHGKLRARKNFLFLFSETLICSTSTHDNHNNESSIQSQLIAEKIFCFTSKILQCFCLMFSNVSWKFQLKDFHFQKAQLSFLRNFVESTSSLFFISNRSH